MNLEATMQRLVHAGGAAVERAYRRTQTVGGRLVERTAGLLRRPQAVLGITPAELCLVVTVANGRRWPEIKFQDSRTLPPGTLMPGLTKGNVQQPGVLEEIVLDLVHAAHDKVDLGVPGSAALVVPDSACRIAAVPFEGQAPGRSDGDSMARWALRDLVPTEASELRVSWTAVRGEGSARSGREGLLVCIGAMSGVVREYEMLVERFDWPVGRVLPWSLSVAAGAASSAGVVPGSRRAKIFLVEVGGTLSCLVEGTRGPRFHRVWHGRLAEDRIEHELRLLRQFLSDSLELTPEDVYLYGDEAWRGPAAEACRRLGWNVGFLDHSVGLTGALVS